MSRFSIYQIDHYDPQVVGKRKRRLRLIYGALYTLYMVLLQIGLLVLHLNLSLVFFTLTPLILGLTLYLNYRLKSDLKKIKIIGDIEFNRSGIKKRIGDSVVEYEFSTIKRIELQKHIPSISVSKSKSGYFSYILKILFINSSSESFVVSDKPSEKKMDLSIVDTMKTLKKFIEPEVSLKM
jgi:hypothetical protein